MIDMVWRILSNNWYTISLNSKTHRLFASSRGVKQGDPLSPSLFIIMAEVLSRFLNQLNEEDTFIGYGMPKGSDKINHLSSADDIILFFSANKKLVKMMIEVLRRYENISGQLINLSKSFLYLHEKDFITVGQKLRRWTGIGQGSFPFTYLGCPIFYGRKKKVYFEEMIKKITAKILSWKGKLLSARGKYIFIKYVLQSIPIYQISEMNPPKRV